MEKRIINNFIIFIPGVNQSRVEKRFDQKNIFYYDQASFEADFHHEVDIENSIQKQSIKDQLMLNEGDVVINNSLQLATIVGKANVGKVLSINFTKASFYNEQLDKRYFLYLFNVFKEVQRQKERGLQGSGLVQRLSIKTLERLEIPVPALSEQQIIGKIFMETSQLQSKLRKYGNLMEQYTNSLIEMELKRGE